MDASLAASLTANANAYNSTTISAAIGASVMNSMRSEGEYLVAKLIPTPNQQGVNPVSAPGVGGKLDIHA